MRKYLLLFVVLIYAAAVFGQDGDPADKTLNAFSKWYAVEAPDSIYMLFSDGMKHAITVESWRQVFPRIKSSLGVIGAFTPEGSGAQYHNFVAIGEKDSMGLRLSLDSSYHIQGIFPRPKP